MQLSTSIDEQLFSLTCEQFYFTVSSRPQLLQRGYQLVYKYLSLSPMNREQTLLHLLSDQAPVLTLVTRTYPVVYADELVGVTQEEKAKTKEYLVIDVLLQKIANNFNKQPFANKKNLSNILLFLIHFHNNQGFEGWVPFYEQLLQQLIISNSPLIGTILIQILKASDDRVSCFSKHILPLIITNQSSLKISQQDSLEIIYYCIKSMAYMNGTEDDVLEEFFEPYEEKIVGYIFVAISKSFRIMKFSLKILTVLVADYEMQLEADMIAKLKECSKQLAIQHLASRLTQSPAQDLQNDDQDQQPSQCLSIIIYQLIELFQTLLNTQQMKMNDYEVFLGLCLPALVMSKSEYLSYDASTEGYLADIEDEGQKCLRNKVVSFLLELYEGDYPAKTKGKMNAELVKYVMLLQAQSSPEPAFHQSLTNFFTHLSLPVHLHKQHLPLISQSLTFLLYHLTDQILTFEPKNIEQHKQTLMLTLGKNLQTSATFQSRLIKVACINLLNKLVKSMDRTVMHSFYTFLVDTWQQVADYAKDKGFVLSLCRGIAYVSGHVQVDIVQQHGQKGVSLIMLEQLVKYLMDPETLQQSSHLILQFLLTLLKNTPQASTLLKQIIPSQLQVHILTTFVHDGTIADVVIDLLAEIASEEFVAYIYVEFLKGSAKEENLTLLIAKWIQIQKLTLKENDLKNLLTVYDTQFVARIIKEFLSTCQRQKIFQSLSQQSVTLLNDKIHPSWILPLIGCNLLRNPESLLINTIQTITYQLTSQYEIENQLLLPFYTFINNPAIGLNIIKSSSPQLYADFINKLIRYAALFQGPNLKVITSHVLLNICELDPTQIKPVFELISSYGSKGMETDEWEDQDKDEENVIDRIFNMKMVNDDVEKDFAQIFSNIVYDMALVTSKVAQLMK